MSIKKQLSQRDSNLIGEGGYILEINNSEQKKEFFDWTHSFSEDVWILDTERFSIDDAQKVIEALAIKSDSNRIVVINCVVAGREAQNALLKSLEELNLGTRFFWLIPDANHLIPTILSRLIKLNIEILNVSIQKEKKSFLDLSAKEKVDFVDKMILGIKDEEKSKVEFLKWLDQLIVDVQKRGDWETLKSLWLCRKYALDHASSVKILAERALVAVL